MMNIFRKEKLVERAAQMSPYFIDAMFSLSDLPVVVDIRAIGMLAAVEVAVDSTPGARGLSCRSACSTRASISRVPAIT